MKIKKLLVLEAALSFLIKKKACIQQISNGHFLRIIRLEKNYLIVIKNVCILFYFLFRWKAFVYNEVKVHSIRIVEKVPQMERAVAFVL